MKRTPITFGTTPMFNIKNCIEQAKKTLLSNRKITVNNCWEWTRAKTGSGYGATTFLGQYISTHRLSLRLFNPEVYKENLLVLHHCDNTLCFNPEHLYCGTASDNTNDSYARGQVPYQLAITHCPAGHEYSVENTYASKVIQRNCKICHREASKRYRTAHKRGVF